MKKNLLTLILLITAVCWSNNAFAQPTNNECSGASPVFGFPGEQLIYGPYDNREATSEASDPADPGFPDGSIDNTTWYSLMGDGNTYFIYTSSNCGVFNLTDTYITDGVSAQGDTQMAIYSGGCDGLELVAVSEDNLHAPGYDLNGVYPAGIVLDTEAGVEYSIMIDGFNGSNGLSSGEFCIILEDWVCGANIELAEGQETSIELCAGDSADIAVNDATLNFGGASIGLGLNYGIVWVMTGEDPMGEHPAFVDSYLGFVGTDYVFEGDAAGVDPFFDLGCIWVTPITVAEVTGAGSAFLSSGCQAISGESIEICFSADGEGECGDVCSEANVDLADGTPSVITLCPDDIATINFNEETINYGGLAGDNPAAIWVVNTVDPMGDPIGSPGNLSLVSDLPGGGGADTLWITFTLVENLNDDGTIDWICRPLSETVQVIWYDDEDPACDATACGLAEGDVGELSSVGETTVCVGDGVADEVDFSTSAAMSGEGTSYGYLITTDEGDILSPGVVEGMTLTQDFEGAGTGICLVWGVIWEGDVANAFVQGENAFDIADELPIDACIDITDPIEITREECLEPLAAGDAGTSVDGNSYRVSFGISGGSGDYTADGGTIDGNTFTSDAIDCGTSYSFTVTDNNTGEQVVVEGDAPCAASACPMSLMIVEDCNNESSGVVIVTIMGGTAPYTVAGFINDVYEDTNVFQFDIFTDGESYEITVTDDSGCEAVASNGTLTCSKCKNEAGTLSATPDGGDTACGANGTVSVTLNGTGTVDANPDAPDIAASVRDYILHTDPTDPEGSMVAMNDTGVFTIADAGGAGTYYITTVVGRDEDGNGDVDVPNDALGLLGDECSFASNAVEVVFAEGTELQVTAEENCNQDTETVTVTVSIVGGADDATYDVSGTFEATGQGSTFSFSGVSDGEIYTVNVTEVGGCGTGSLVSAPVICQKEDAVEWLSFEGEVQAQGNFLTWATASEINNEYFSVERSLDGKNFVEVARVNAVGESFTATSYDYLDRTAPAGVSYYRITQYDFDGQNDATNVISLTRGEGAFGIANVRPVPAADYIEIAFTAISNGSVELTVYDMTGRVMLQSNVDATTGINTRSIDVSTYAAGVYMISVNNGTEVATQRLVKE